MVSENLNGLQRVRENIRQEMKRLEGLINKANPQFSDRHLLGRIDALRWVEMNITLEIDYLTNELQKEIR